MANVGRAISGAGTGAATGAAVGGVPGAIAGGILGLGAGLLSGDDGSQAAQDAINKAIAQYDALGLPPNLSAPIIYQQLQQGGQLTPQLEAALANVDASFVQDSVDTRAQLNSALQNIQAKAYGGLSPEQMANQQKLLQQVNANTQAQFKGILNGQAARGQSGSGDSLAAMLNAAQGGAQQASQNALQIGAQGSELQNQAMKDYLAGVTQMRMQDQQRDTNNAQLQQQANIYNSQNSSSRQARNIAAMNEANQYNLNRQNYVNDANINQANQERLRQENAKRQYWQDQLALASGKANAYTGQANVLTQQAQNSNQNWNNALQGIGQMGAAYGQYNNNQNKQTPVAPTYDYSGTTQTQINALGNSDFYGDNYLNGYANNYNYLNPRV